jgi:hypothetical protein
MTAAYSLDLRERALARKEAGETNREIAAALRISPSWLMSIPRSERRSSTLRSDSGYLTYIITTRRITSGELLKYRNGSLMA